MKRTILCLCLAWCANQLSAQPVVGVSAPTNGKLVIHAPAAPGELVTFENSSNLLDWQVGAIRSGSAVGNAQLDEDLSLSGSSRFYRTRSSGSIAGLLSWWHGDGNGQDGVGTNHARLVNDLGFGPAQFGKGFNFGGANAWLDIGGQPVQPPWTFTCWVNRRAGLDSSASLLGDLNTALKLEQYPFTYQVGFTRFGVADYLFNYTAPTNAWTHLAFVSETNRTVLYAAGLPVATNSATIPLPLAYLGGATQDRLNGVVDEAMVFGRALTSQEVFALYSLPRVTASRVPQLSALSTTNGPATGGTSVTITGTNFLGATRVLFADTPVSFTIVNDGRIDVITPANYAGPKQVRIESAGGVSAPAPKGVFKYDYVCYWFDGLPDRSTLNANGNSDITVRITLIGLPPGATATYVWGCDGIDNSQGDDDCQAAQATYLGTTDLQSLRIHLGPFTNIQLQCTVTTSDGTQIHRYLHLISDAGGG